MKELLRSRYQKQLEWSLAEPKETSLSSNTFIQMSIFDVWFFRILQTTHVVCYSNIFIAEPITTELTFMDISPKDISISS